MYGPLKVEYMVFPRIAALSEVLWSPKESKDYKNFESRLPVIFKRYDRWGINYSKAYYDIRPTIKPAPGNKGVLWVLETATPTQIFVSDSSATMMVKVMTPDWKKDKEGSKGIMKDSMIKTTASFSYKTPVTVIKNKTLSAINILSRDAHGRYITGARIEQKFYFNKATGKKITLATAPANNYPGNGGAFGLINGAYSEKGIGSPEWLGWSGPDMEATIDLITPVKFSSVSIHTMEQNGGWVYLPASVEIFISKDGKKFTSAGTTAIFQKDNSGYASGYMKVGFQPVTARYIKVVAKAYGKIPEGKPGAGNNAWLFVDEIQVD
jgi:hexosaminidase